MKTAKPPSKVPRPVLKGTKKPITDKVIPFVSDDQENQTQEDEDQLKAYVQKAIHALEKGNSVAAYNLLKRIIS